MTGMKFVRNAAFGAATIGMAFPSSGVLAGSRPTIAKPSRSSAHPTTLVDVALTSGGTLTGRLVDQSGTPIDGAQVTLHQGKQPIGQTITGKDGQYSFTNLRGGVYRVTSADTEGIFRVWADKSAPPSARDHALLVAGQNNARGQLGAISPAYLLVAGGATSAAGISAVTLDRAQRVDSTSSSHASTAARTSGPNSAMATNSNGMQSSMPLQHGGSPSGAAIPNFIGPNETGSGSGGSSGVAPISDDYFVKPVSP